MAIMNIPQAECMKTTGMIHRRMTIPRVMPVRNKISTAKALLFGFFIGWFSLFVWVLRFKGYIFVCPNRIHFAILHVLPSFVLSIRLFRQALIWAMLIPVPVAASDILA